MKDKKTTIKLYRTTIEMLKAKRCPKNPTIETVILNLLKEDDKIKQEIETLKQEKENLIKIITNPEFKKIE